VPLTGKNITRGIQFERLEGSSTGNAELKTAALPVGAVNNGDMVFESLAYVVGVGAITAGEVTVSIQQSEDEVDGNFVDLEGALATSAPNSLLLAEATMPQKLYTRLRITRSGGAAITHVTALRTPLEVPAVHGPGVAAVTTDDFIQAPAEVVP